MVFFSKSKGVIWNIPKTQKLKAASKKGLKRKKIKCDLKLWQRTQPSGSWLFLALGDPHDVSVLKQEIAICLCFDVGLFINLELDNNLWTR